MKKFYILLFISLSFVIGVLCSFFLFKAQDFWKEWSKPSIYSTDIIKDKCATMGIVLPEKAWDVNMLWQPHGPDVSCHLTFSAGNKDIDTTIGNIKKQESSKTSNFTVPVPVDKNGKSFKWWTDMKKDKLKIYKGSHYWIGYDKEKSHVYIYKFST
tara:strand:+ start:232 stop:699 length:468 start_codon:yes stop_codon:yes gene_type:complete